MSSSALCAALLPSPPVICFAEETGDRGGVLHVDDDPVSSLPLCEWLRWKGYEVAHADGPAAANALLAEREFDVVISDIHMPGNERLEWVEQVLQRPCPPPIILLTGNPGYETACRAANLVVAGYLVKPPDFALLETSLPRIVAEQRQRREFLRVSHAILGLLSAHGANGLAHERALVERLAGLSHHFAAQCGRSGGASAASAPAGDETWRAVIGETIAVIEKTKDSFRSKELGQLRLRLQRMLAAPKPSAVPAGSKKYQAPAWCAEIGFALRCEPRATA